MSTSNPIQVAGPPNLQETAQIFLQWMLASTGVVSDTNIGSIIRTFAESIGSVTETEGITSQAQAFQALIYSAYDAFGITPFPASPSIGTVTFQTVNGQNLPSGVSVTIPLGSLVQTNGGIQFSTTSTAFIASGSSSTTAIVASSLTGAINNVPANTIVQLLASVPYPMTVNNPLPTTGGANAETPSQTLSRLLAFIDSLGLCSPIAIASALINMPNVNGEYIRYATVYEGWIQQALLGETPTAGYTCYVDNGGGAASSALLSTAFTYLSSGSISNIPIGFDSAGNVITSTQPIGFRPAGVPYGVLSVLPLYVNVSVQASAINYSNASAIQNAILQAISGYFASLNFAGMAEVSQLTVAIGNVTFGQISSLTVILEDSAFNPISAVTANYNQRIIIQNTSVIITSIPAPITPYTGPQFRGYATGPPTGLYNPGCYNVGDRFFLGPPTIESNNPDGWVCIIAGCANPCNLTQTCGTWRTIGIVGDT